MRPHRLKLMALCFVAGAVASMAIAWGCAMFSTPNWRSAVPVDPERASAIRSRYAPSDWPIVRAAGYQQRGFGVQLIWTHSDHDGAAEGPGTSGNTMLSMQVMELAAGWPLPAMRCGILADGTNIRYVGAVRPSGAIPSGEGLFSHALPYQPLVSGWLADAVFFAAIIWLAVRGPWESRRRWREWHSRCGACGYPWGHGATCTECGCDLTKAWWRTS